MCARSAACVRRPPHSMAEQVSLLVTLRVAAPPELDEALEVRPRDTYRASLLDGDQIPALGEFVHVRDVHLQTLGDFGNLVARRPVSGVAGAGGHRREPRLQCAKLDHEA